MTIIFCKGEKHKRVMDQEQNGKEEREKGQRFNLIINFSHFFPFREAITLACDVERSSAPK